MYNIHVYIYKIMHLRYLVLRNVVAAVLCGWKWGQLLSFT